MLRACLHSHDAAAVVGAVVTAVDEGLSIERLYDEVLGPFLVWVGEQWQDGKAQVWEEHLMAAAVRTAVDALHPRVQARKAAAEAVPVTVAFFCPPEENHELGLRMLADRFDMRGFRTVYVGAMTPWAQMIDCARTVGADVICLSASTHFHRVALHDGVAALQKALPGVRVVVGGPAFTRSPAGWEAHLIGSVDRLLDDLRPAAPAGQAAAAGEAATSGEAAPDA